MYTTIRARSLRPRNVYQRISTAGAMLAQKCMEAPDTLKPVAFYHHELSKAEQGYSATEKELLAMVKAVVKFRVCLGKGVYRGERRGRPLPPREI